MEKIEDKIQGAINSIRFQKPDTGFIIASFSGETNFNALGTIPNAQVGMEYILTGTWKESQYGQQFEFIRFETVEPVSTVGIFRYIVRICKFVGPSVADDLIRTHGGNTLKILKHHPETAAQTRGITLDRAKEIQKSLKENEELEKVTIELEAYLDVTGMHKNLPGKLIAIFRHRAAEIVRKNPYIISTFPGIGFALADRVAIKNKYARDHVNRKKAAALHVLNERRQEGDIWISSSVLIDGMRHLIQVQNLTEGLESLLLEHIIVKHKHISDTDDFSWALIGPARDEYFIAKKIHALISEYGGVA